jgi:hypothetical protein
MNKDDRNYWLSIAARLQSRLRRLLLLGGALFVIIVGDWFLTHENLASEQYRMTHEGNKLIQEPQFEKELKSVFNGDNKDPNCRFGKDDIVNSVNLMCFRFLSVAIDKFKNKMSEQQKKFMDYELPLSVYRLVILVSPILLLILTLFSIWQLTKVHSRFRDHFDELEIQQTLNSPYFTRITQNFADGRMFHSLLAALMNFIHVANAVIYIPTVMIWENVVKVVFVTQLAVGVNVFAERKSGATTLETLLTLQVIITLIFWLWVSWSFWRSYSRKSEIA